MSRSVQAFRQTDVVKALKAARNAGLQVQRYEIGRDGKIVIDVGKPEAPEIVRAESGGGPNEWDDVK